MYGNFHTAGPKNAVFGPKSNMAQKSDFYAFHCIAWHRMVLHGIALYLMVSHSFHVIPLYRMALHGIVLYLTVLHGIALLGSARGLYLARHLSTLSDVNKFLNTSHSHSQIKHEISSA